MPSSSKDRRFPGGFNEMHQEGKRKQPMRVFGRILIITLLVTLAVSPALSEGEFRPLPIDLSGGAPYQATFTKSTMVYEDPTIRVERTPECFDQASGIRYYAADIRIKDPSQIRTAAADPSDFLSERRIHAEVIASRVNAVFAMNGDYCGDYRSSISVKYVLRQGTVYRDSVDTSLDLLLIDEDGDFHIIPGGKELEDMDKTQINGKKVYNALQFGPALVIDGQPVEDSYVLDDSHSPLFAKPAAKAVRICIAQTGPLQYKAVCTKYAYNMAKFKQLIVNIAPGCSNAYVLDGGGSAQLAFLGKIVNYMNGKNSNLRRVSDILYFASAWFED